MIDLRFDSCAQRDLHQGEEIVTAIVTDDPQPASNGVYVWTGVAWRRPEGPLQETMMEGRRIIREVSESLGGYGVENQEQILRGDYSCVSPEDVAIFKKALQR